MSTAMFTGLTPGQQESAISLRENPEAALSHYSYNESAYQEQAILDATEDGVFIDGWEQSKEDVIKAQVRISEAEATKLHDISVISLVVGTVALLGAAYGHKTGGVKFEFSTVVSAANYALGALNMSNSRKADTNAAVLRGVLAQHKLSSKL